MILGMSRFKVANGLEAEVKQAFLHRPHLVDHVPGFLGMETFTEEKDATAFYLLTRWTDAGSFRAWHASPAHHQSHRGIPKGLKLDPAFTKILVLDRLSDPALASSRRENIDDAGELLADVLAASETLHLLVGTPTGVITACNDAIARALASSDAEIIGHSLWEHLAEVDGTALRERMASGRRSPNERFPLRFQSAGRDPFTLSCWLDMQPTHFTIIGEPSHNREVGHEEQLHATNNELSVLAREHARRGKELSAAKAQLQETLDELHRTHWHLRKIAEVLPMCAECGKVKLGDGEWASVTDYLRENSLFLSHGCCPACAGKMKAALQLPVTEDA
jgi:heme-degrading monooxygenase HmoA